MWHSEIKILEGVSQDVLYIWHTELWPGRSDIRDMSSMILLGGYDMSIYSRYHPRFAVAMYQGEVIGVNSGHAVSDTAYRSRGLWVNPGFRGFGLGVKLLQKVEEFAREDGKVSVWSYPKDTALKTYISAGYQTIGDPVVSPSGSLNYWAIREIPY